MCWMPNVWIYLQVVRDQSGLVCLCYFVGEVVSLGCWRCWTNYMAVQFVPFKTFVDSLFWDELTKRKLNDWKLDESPRPVAATYSNRQLLRSVCAASKKIYER